MLRFINRLCAVIAASLLLAPLAQAELLGRDINGLAVSNSSAVFLYEVNRQRGHG